MACCEHGPTTLRCAIAPWDQKNWDIRVPIMGYWHPCRLNLLMFSGLGLIGPATTSVVAPRRSQHHCHCPNCGVIKNNTKWALPKNRGHTHTHISKKPWFIQVHHDCLGKKLQLLGETHHAGLQGGRAGTSAATAHVRSSAVHRGVNPRFGYLCKCINCWI